MLNLMHSFFGHERLASSLQDLKKGDNPLRWLKPPAIRPFPFGETEDKYPDTHHTCPEPVGPRAFALRSAGFSLVEVTIAIAVMIGALLAFMGVEVTIMRAGGQASRRWEAVRMARNRVERLRGDGYEAVLGTDGLDANGQGIRCSWAVCAEGSLPDLARIDVVCDWPGTLAGRSIVMTTLLAK